MKHLVAAVFGLSMLQATTSQASIIIDTAQVGSDVVFSFSGTFDLTNLSSILSNNPNQVVSPFAGAILFSGSGALDAYGMSDKLPSFGSVGATFGIAVGDTFKLGGDTPTYLAFSEGYAGALISGSLTIANSSFVILGLLAGQYTTTASNGQYVQLNIPSEVPIPAALPLLAAGLGAMGLLGWRRRKTAVAG